MQRGRAFRRDRERVAKLRAFRKLRDWRLQWEDDPSMNIRWVNIWASTHCRPCSCCGCGNPRKWFKEITWQEKRAAISAREQIEEQNNE